MRHNKYGKAAQHAVSLYHEKRYDIAQCWELAVMKQFPTQEAAREKSCPRTAFLGLCEDGLVKGVPKGSYSRGFLNKAYAVKAVGVLLEKNDEHISAKELWKLVMQGEQKKPNSQMDVVLGLWNSNLINK